MGPSTGVKQRASDLTAEESLRGGVGVFLEQLLRPGQVVILLLGTSCGGIGDQPEPPATQGYPPAAAAPASPAPPPRVATLPIAVLERHDVSLSDRQRLTISIRLGVDTVPADSLIAATADSIWSAETTQWAEFTVFGYLPGQAFPGAAYSVAEYRLEARTEFRTSPLVLLGTRWSLKATSTPAVRTFSLSATARKLDSKTIAIQGRTTLPERTGVLVTVSRDYWQRGSSDTYAGTIYEQDLPVRNGAVDVLVEVNDRLWLDNHAEKVASMPGIFGEVRRLSEAIEVRLMFSPARQRGTVPETVQRHNILEVTRKLTIPVQR